MSRLPASIQPTGNTTYIVPRTVLKVEGLVKIYGQRRVVDGVDFHVNKGEVVGLLGPNGAGKTTSFRMTCGLIDANAGVVFLNGKDVTTWPLYRRAREGGMGYLPQAASVFQQLSVQDNLLGMMEMIGMNAKTRREKCDSLLEKMKLGHLRKNKARGLSGGERRRLEIARALVSDPKIILLDEPFAAIDPITVQNLQVIIRQLCSEGISILITDHGVTETLQITDRSYIIEAGKVLCSGTPAEVLANEAAQRAYFGKPAHIGPIPGMSGGIGATNSHYGSGTSGKKSGGPGGIGRIDAFDDLTPGHASHATRKPSARPLHPKFDLTDDLAQIEESINDDTDIMSTSRRRPSVKVRYDRPERQYSEQFSDSFSDDFDNDRNVGRRDSSNDVRPPKYSQRQGGVRERRFADEPIDGDANRKPMPRASLLGRISGIFKKPKE